MMVGRVEYMVTGVKGPECLEITKNIQKAIGKQVHQELTEEYYEAPRPKRTELEFYTDYQQTSQPSPPSGGAEEQILPPGGGEKVRVWEQSASWENDNTW
eukprot:CAMPEP_0118722518 /NCGR_PEP_ID=MMETSP0800-20121206/31462_1 /TAXON_ID=210618 ORGANISM="Striatella unipunctata, Strain CCMP2910" /NCGR_SAMPLE_ID=MMETSP0800 /ASSEMBLY_ACC=CAM_ASM_000638 /LENGTH=99 /DNA_ID=CAMNT_0006630781 /DNA_START=202 /DNA_END=501 /DNA_ORIENTATION=-